MTQPGAPPIALLVLDLVMPDLDGMGVLGRMRDTQAHDAGHRADRAWLHRDGDFRDARRRAGLRRQAGRRRAAANLDQERLCRSTRSPAKCAASASARRALLTFKDLVSRSPEMARVIRLGERSAHSTIPVLIEGESGVGKEIVARAIQGASDRRGKPFVTVNCGALPANLVESILFGHEKGAFTGATEKHVGKFVEANGGTLFLDEIGELPLDLQVKLLRALQEGEIDPDRREAAGARRCQADLGDQSKSDRAGQARAVSRGSVLPAQRVSRSAFRRCARAARIFPISRGAFARASPPRKAATFAASPPRPCRCSRHMIGPATCANWRTPCSARLSWPRATS